MNATLESEPSGENGKKRQGTRLWRIVRSKWTRRSLFVLVALVTLIALFYAEENWRGRRAWERYRAALAERGVSLDYRKVVPEPVPDDQNFAATPLWAGLSFVSGEQAWDTNRWPQWAGRLLSEVRRYEAKGGAEERTRLDYRTFDLAGAAEILKRTRAGESVAEVSDAYAKIPMGEDGRPPSWPAMTNAEARASAAKQLLEGLKEYESALEELRAAAARPHSRFSIEYDKENPIAIFLPHLAKIKSICQVVQLKTMAELGAGRVDRALEDGLLGLRVADAVASEPFVISYLVRLAGMSIAMNGIWQGLEWHLWNDAQLARIQEALRAREPMDAARTALHGERVICQGVFDMMRRSSRDRSVADWWGGGPDDEWQGSWISSMPGGWLYFEQLNYNRMFDVLEAAGRPEGKAAIDPSKVADAMEKAKPDGKGVRTFFLDHTMFARLLMPALDKVYFKAAHAQARRDLLIAACALERHRLKHGSYPRALGDVDPAVMGPPLADVVGGGPYRYEPSSEGGFKLYSIGWNRSDEGGTSGEDMEGDWVMALD